MIFSASIPSMASSSTTPSSSSPRIFDSSSSQANSSALATTTLHNKSVTAENSSTASTNKNVSQVCLNSSNSESIELKSSQADQATTSQAGTSSLLSVPVLKHSTATTISPSESTTPKSNIISLVALKSPQNHQKLFPWSINDANNNNNNNSNFNGTVLTNNSLPMNNTTNGNFNSPGSPSSNSGSPPLSFNSIKYQNSTSHSSIGSVVDTASNPKVLRQQVMLGNNNRLNFAHLTNNRTTSDSIQVVLKKSSNQTIVIVSKPPSAPATQSNQQQQAQPNVAQPIGSPVQQQNLQLFVSNSVSQALVGGADENKSDILSKS